MRTTSFILLSALASSAAFSQAPSFSTRSIAVNKPLRMTVKAPVVVTGDNIDLTPALTDYVNQKIDRTVGKLPTAVAHCDVYLSVNKNPKVENGHTAEVVTTLKGTTFRVAESTPDMYTSIDLVASRLARKLRKYKERRLDGYHGGPNMGENLADVLNSIEVDDDEEEVYIDPEQTVVTKIKSFDLSKPISIKEAIFALDYIDHDFYVFRDEETNEVSVVYKRNAGGVGLIQPEQ
jgi:putative sigma-54 modulation protein